MKHQVFVTQYVFPEAVARLRSAGLEVIAREADTPAAAAELRAAAQEADGLMCLLTDRVDAALLAACPRLRVVANVAVGVDNIDVPSATDHGVMVANTPGVLTEATADLAWSLILSAARRVPEGDEFLRAGKYTHWKLAQEQIGADVYGRTLGIYGLGAIGKAVARRGALGFDMTVLYHSRTRLPEDHERGLGVRYVSMDELLSASDFLSLHAPLTAETRHVIDADALEQMKPTAILVNTARGALVDEAALSQALAAGTIAGAGLDVFEDEPAVNDALLGQRERVVLLPHLGSATETTRRRMATMAAENVIAALSGKRPSNLVNREVVG